MRQFLFGLLMGTVLATAGGVWAWGHTPTDQLRGLRDDLQRQQQQEQIDRMLRPLQRPC